jgi:hypothetical protein
MLPCRSFSINPKSLEGPLKAWQLLGKNVTASFQPDNKLLSGTSSNKVPFQGLLDATAIIMEIIKQVSNS